MDRGAWQAIVHAVEGIGHNLATQLPPPEVFLYRTRLYASCGPGTKFPHTLMKLVFKHFYWLGSVHIGTSLVFEDSLQQPAISSRSCTFSPPTFLFTSKPVDSNCYH